MRNLTRLTVVITISSLALSCSSVDVYNDSAKTQLYDSNFGNTFGNTDTAHVWNTFANITANVKVNYSENDYTISFYNTDPFSNTDSIAADAYLLGQEYVKGGVDNVISFNAPINTDTVYATCEDAAEGYVTKVAAISDGKINVTFGSESTKGISSRAASGECWEKTTEQKEFSKADIAEVTKALPLDKDVKDKRNNFEFVSNGAFTVYPIYSATSKDDKIGFYYYNPTKGIGKMEEVELINNIHKLEKGDLSKYYIGFGQEYWTETAQFSNSFITTGLRSKGYTINVPKGYRIGFYSKNSSYTCYTNKTLNEKTEYQAAIITNEKGNTYIGLEDTPYNTKHKTKTCTDFVLSLFGLPNAPDPVDTKKTSKTETATFAFEDLGATNDFDFNDIVLYVNAKYSSKGNTLEIRLVAHGGTLPASVYYDKKKLFDIDGSMTNTTNYNKDDVKSTTITMPAGFDLSSSYYTSKFKIIVNDTHSTYTISTDNKSKAPQALVISGEWQWPAEQVNIGDAYPTFNDWAKDSKAARDWYKNPTAGKVIIVNE